MGWGGYALTFPNSPNCSNTPCLGSLCTNHVIVYNTKVYRMCACLCVIVYCTEWLATMHNNIHHCICWVQLVAPNHWGSFLIGCCQHAWAKSKQPLAWWGCAGCNQSARPIDDRLLPPYPLTLLAIFPWPIAWVRPGGSQSLKPIASTSKREETHAYSAVQDKESVCFLPNRASFM